MLSSPCLALNLVPSLESRRNESLSSAGTSIFMPAVGFPLWVRFGWVVRFILSFRSLFRSGDAEALIFGLATTVLSLLFLFLLSQHGVPLPEVGLSIQSSEESPQSASKLVGLGAGFQPGGQAALGSRIGHSNPSGPTSSDRFWVTGEQSVSTGQ